MWLIYLRFEDQGQTVAMHVRTNNKANTQQIIAMAGKHGYTGGARLIDYASFYASGAIKFSVSGLHYQQDSDFYRRWELAEKDLTRTLLKSPD